MATRNRAQRGDNPGKEGFVGRVRKWRKEWKPAGTDHKSMKLMFQRWVATEERDASSPGARHPHITPEPTPTGKPPPPMFMRPLWQQRLAAAVPSGAGAAAGPPQPAAKVTLKLKLNGGGGIARQPSSGEPGRPGAAPAASPPPAAGPR